MGGGCLPPPVPSSAARRSATITRMELATRLRTWRDRLDPADAGLPRQSLRRAPGLRREEVAQLAGLSVNYLTRLEQGRAQFEVQAVGDLLAALGRSPEDAELRSLVGDLRARSPRFEALWGERPARRMGASRKTFVHPEAGRLTVDCDVLEVHGSDLRVIVYTAAPGTPDASALRLLGVLGLERFTATAGAGDRGERT